jgi:uncharacterized membrane protein
MQAPLAVVSFLLGLAAWVQTSHAGWLAGALLMVANLPVSIFAILPLNNRLLAIDPANAGPDTKAMLEDWGRRHAIRTALGLAACLLFLWMSQV